MEELICTAILDYSTENLAVRVFLTNWQNFPKAPTKVSYSCPKYTPSTGSTSQSPSSVFMHQLSHQTSIYKFKLFGAIVPLICNLHLTLEVIWKPKLLTHL